MSSSQILPETVPYSDPPPLGYRSEQGRKVYIGLMIAFAIVTVAGPFAIQFFEQFRMQRQFEKGFTIVRSFKPELSARWGDFLVVGTEDQYVGGVGGVGVRGSLVAFSLKDGSGVKLPMEANGEIARPLADSAALAVLANDQQVYLITIDALYRAEKIQGGISVERETQFDLAATGGSEVQSDAMLIRGRPVCRNSTSILSLEGKRILLLGLELIDGGLTSYGIGLNLPEFMTPENEPPAGNQEEPVMVAPPGENMVVSTNNLHVKTASLGTNVYLVVSQDGKTVYRSIEADQFLRPDEPQSDQDPKPNPATTNPADWEKLDVPADLLPLTILPSSNVTRLVMRDVNGQFYSVYERTAEGWSAEPRLVTRADLEVNADAEVFAVTGASDDTIVFITNDVAHGLRMHPLINGELQKPIKLAGWAAQPAVAYYLGIIQWNMIFGFSVLIFIGLVPTILMAMFRTNQLELSDQTVEMASILRRGIARTFDFMIFSIPPYALAGYYIYQMDWSELIGTFQNGNMVEKELTQWAIWALVVGLGYFSYFLIVFLMYCWVEGTWGTTPGKFLCRIETLRTTLRPCGFFRSILRNAAILIDGFFNYVVGVMLIGLQYKWQRVGDLLADTVVVRTYRPQHNSDDL